MEHLSDNELLTLLEQASDRAAALRAHLEVCDGCRQRWRSLQESWDALGAWTVKGPEIDLADRILERAGAVHTVTLWQPQAWVRIAASIIIGVGLGALMGRIGSGPVSAEQVSQAIYLDTLALNSATGWAAPLLDGPQEPRP